VQVDPELVLTAPDFSPEGGAAAIVEALTRGIRFDGVLCRDDKFALGALKALHAANLDVPGDVAVVGWDDTALTSYTSPTLSSISPNKIRLAQVALELLEERMNGYQGMGRHRVVPHSLSVRESAPAVAPALR
jgi:DNA-binding LacI/PurR family transcriptional regulator